MIGEDGRVSEVGRTSTWSAYIGNIQFANENDDPYVGIRSVSKDMKTYSPIEWVHIARSTETLPEAFQLAISSDVHQLGCRWLRDRFENSLHCRK